MKLSRRSVGRLLELARVGLMHARDGGIAADSAILNRARAALLPEEKRAKGGVSSRNKGKAGEREAVLYLKDQGFSGDLKRGLQSRGGGKEQADVMNVGCLHVEAKRVEKLNIHAAMQQACDDCSEGKIPIVLHRRNNEPWKVTLRGDDFFRIFRESEFMEERDPICENNLPDCGPAAGTDSAGVPLCLRCAAEMEKDPSCHSKDCPCFLCAGPPSCDGIGLTGFDVGAD